MGFVLNFFLSKKNDNKKKLFLNTVPPSRNVSHKRRKEQCVVVGGGKRTGGLSRWTERFVCDDDNFFSSRNFLRSKRFLMSCNTLSGFQVQLEGSELQFLILLLLIVKRYQDSRNKTSQENTEFCFKN